VFFAYFKRLNRFPNKDNQKFQTVFARFLVTNQETEKFFVVSATFQNAKNWQISRFLVKFLNKFALFDKMKNGIFRGKILWNQTIMEIHMQDI